MTTRNARLWLLGAVVADIALRLRFLNVPLSVDEAGYGQVARLWSRGFALYGETAWVDRPQGLVGLYRLAVWFGDEWAIRMLALTAGVVLVVAVAVIAWTIGGPRVGILAGWLIALLGPAPHLEGFTANGELLGGAVAAAAIAVAIRWSVRPRLWILLTTGVVAGCAPLVKQSAFDGVVVAAAVVLVIAVRERAWRAGVTRILVLTVGIAIPWVLAMLLAASASPGVGGWWYAIYGYRAATESLLSGDFGFRLQLLGKSILPMLVDGAPLLVFGVVGFVVLRRQSQSLIPLVWLGACAVGFLAGGLYHPHYWVQMLPPLAIFAGLGADHVCACWPRRRALAMAGVVVAIPLLASLPVYFASTPELASARSTNDPRVISARPVGAAVAAATTPTDRVQVLWANAAVYWYADRIPATRYLWYRNIERIPGASAHVAAVFAGSNQPAIAVEYQPVDALNADGSIQQVLDAQYQSSTVDGIRIWQHH